MPKKLRTVIDEIMHQQNWTQAQLAKELGTEQVTISRMRVGSDWELHFKIITRLHQICETVSGTNGDGKQ